MTDFRFEIASVDNFAALAELFDSDPQCRECWCMNHRCAPGLAPISQAAREALLTSIHSGRARGVLAFRGSEIAAWCSVDPLDEQPGHDFVIERPQHLGTNSWSIHCLFVASKFRAQGLSTQLVKQAVGLTRAAKGHRVFAFPIPATSRENFPEGEAEFSGRESTYRKAGFREIETLNEFYRVFCLDL